MTAWLEVSLSLPRELAELAENALEEQGALAITFQDSADDPVLEPAPGAAPLWPTVTVRGLFGGDADRRPVSAALLMLPGVARPEALAWREVADQDWTRAWMDRFQPMKFGEHLWIVPSGMQAPADAQAVVLKLDPGLAFGTGTHPTTALCLDWIDGHDFTGLTVVDYGCGSGVLGIAAALKGARKVVCVDNDPQALEATVANAARNDVVDRVVCQSPEKLEGAWLGSTEFGSAGTGQAESGRVDIARPRADVVLANILAQPLIELAPRLSGFLADGGHIVLSGILEEQAAAVVEAYSRFCGNMASGNREGWVRLHGARRL